MHFAQPQDESQLLYAKLSVSVAQEDFNVLWEQLSSSVVAEIKGELIGVGYSNPIEMKGEEPYAEAEVKEIQLRVIEDKAVHDSWFHERVYSDFREALMDVCLPGAHGSQVHTVATEFAWSIAHANQDAEAIKASLARVRLLIAEARPAFRQALTLSPEPWDAWTFSPQEFENAIADTDDARAAQLKRQYDQLWKHFSVTTVVLQGEEKHGAALDGFQPNVESLEYLAERLLTDQKINSPTMEWAIISALIYAECIAFAQTTLSGQSILGMTVPGQLKGLSTPKAVGRRLLRSISAGTFEVVKIGGTFVLASVLAPESVETAWLITTGVTAARWVRAALLQKSKQPEMLHLELLNKMAGVHESLKTTNFNARSLRDQLYRVAADGAVFSPWVFNILDARICREGKPT